MREASPFEPAEPVLFKTSSSELYGVPGTTAKKEPGRLRKAASAVIAAAVAAAKYGALIISKVKFAGVVLTMIISVGAYTLFFGWEFAVGLVLLILVHEYGHVFQLRHEGVPATAPGSFLFSGLTSG
jgi:hypothetical protein